MDSVATLAPEVTPTDSGDIFAEVDKLVEADTVQKILTLVDDLSYVRVGLYLTSMASIMSVPEDRLKIFKLCFDMYLQHKDYPLGLRVALKLNNHEMIVHVLNDCKDVNVLKQLAFILARHRYIINFSEVITAPTIDNDELQRIASLDILTTQFKALGTELDVVEPKTPEEIFKTHLEETRRGAGAVTLDSAKQNLASSFVNSFVNIGFCSDKLMTGPEDNNWLYKNKDLGMMSTVASLGALMLWDVDDGLAKTDKYQWSTDTNIKAGALMAFGLVSSGVVNDCDPAWALLAEHLESETPILKLASVLGLGFAYAGSKREDLLENLAPIILDTSCSLECSAMAAVSLALIYVSSGSDDISQAILSTLVERQQSGAGAGGLDASPFRNFFAVALGILYLGLQNQADRLIEEISSQVTGPLGEYLKIVVETCAYAGTGDVLKVQQLLHLIAEQEGQTAAGTPTQVEPADNAPEEAPTTTKETAATQQQHAAAILGIALIALGDEINTEMTIRTLDHILQYTSGSIRRVVPLALACLHLSWAKVNVIDTLSKLSHDNDSEVAMAAILGMGLVGLGTNNSRLGGQLRQLASYYAKEANILFLIRIAQGLVFAGKGLVSASPLHSDRLLVNPVALGSLIVLFHACLDMKSTILANAHYMLFYLVPAIFPRMLVTLNAEDLTPLPVLVRVGQAVDITGMAGKPRPITGFQTHTTPVLLAYGERAELATEEYLAETSVLEGFVLLRKNPNYRPEETNGA
jgi:26S proteasome regulatory subunit N1